MGGCFRAFNQVALILLNVFLAVSGGAMIAFAVQRKISAPNQTMLCLDSSSVDQSESELLDPFILLLAFGGCLLILGVYGFCGSCCMSERMLMPYFTLLLLCAAGLLYASVFCFLFADKANDYIDAYWGCFVQVIGEGPDQDAVKAFVNENLRTAGAICICGCLIVGMALHGSAVLMKYKVTAINSMRWINVIIFILGGVLVGVGFKFGRDDQKAGDIKQEWLPYVLGALGCVTVVLSFLGWCAAIYQSICLLASYLSLLLVITILITAFFVVAFNFSEHVGAFVHQNWSIIKENVVNITPEEAELYLWQNLTLLGISGMILVIFLIVNILSSIYLIHDCRRERKRDRLEAAEAQGLLVRRDSLPRNIDRRRRNTRRGKNDNYDDDDDYDDFEEERSSRPRKMRAQNKKNAKQQRKRRVNDSEEDDDIDIEMNEVENSDSESENKQRRKSVAKISQDSTKKEEMEIPKDEECA